MTTFIAFFRGINVGGNNILPMKDLVELAEKLGLSQVRTYIQSGNVVFYSPETDAPGLAKKLGAAVKERKGFLPHVLVLAAEDLAKAAAANPFPEGEADPKSLHLFFLSEVPKKADMAGLEALKTGTESFSLKDRVFYLHAPEGIGRSKLAARAEKLLGVEATARNWRTVVEVGEMAGEKG